MRHWSILAILLICTIWYSYRILYFYLAQQKFDISETIKVVLESDGTEIDEEDYFDTLENNTLIMILKPDQKWCPYNDIRYNKLLKFLFYLLCLSCRMWICHLAYLNVDLYNLVRQ